MCQKNPHEKAMQRALIQYRDPKNYQLVLEALKKAGRMDLVGFDKHCLIRPRQKVKDGEHQTHTKQGKTQKKTIRNVHKKKFKKQTGR